MNVKQLEYNDNQANEETFPSCKFVLVLSVSSNVFGLQQKKDFSKNMKSFVCILYAVYNKPLVLGKPIF